MPVRATRCLALFVPLGLAACAHPGVTVDAPGEGVVTLPSDPAAPLPVDPRVHEGTLPNGLRWYVEPNARPEGRAELRLAVKAGSILEDDDQRGLAHFVEHMAFNGTEHFPGNDIIAYLEGLGMRFGAHLNAYTTFDETVYVLQLPTDDPATLASGFMMLRDWATGVTFDPEECEKERGVVLEEWRLGQGLQQRIQDATLPLLFHGSRYLDRLPIGNEATLLDFTCDRAQRFYDTWYRPDLMAVMAVGDFDPKQVERDIRTWFGPLRNPEPERERTWYTVPDQDGPLVGILSDPELPQGAVQIADKVVEVEGQDHQAYRDFLTGQLLFLMLNERLAVASQALDAPFLGAASSESPLGHLRSLQTLMLVQKEGRELDTLQAGLAELERIKRFGFNPGELDRARDELARNMQTYYDERSKTDSSTHIEELLRVYLTDEPMPGIPYEWAMSQVYLPAITLDEVNALARAEGFFPGTSRVIEMLVPQAGATVAPTEAQVLDVMARVPTLDLEPLVEEVDDRPLLAELPTPGTATKVGADPDLGTSTWRLSNGVTVVLKPTTFQEDEVLFQGFSPGGTSVVSDDAFVPAITATSLMMRSGLGDMDVVTLARKLAGKEARVTPSLGRTREFFSGGASTHDLETMFQLLYLSVTAPRFSEDAFALEVQGRREALRNRDASPDAVFEDAFTRLVWGDDPRQTNWTLDELDQMDLATSAAVFRDRFGDVGDFTFVFVGNLDEATFVPLLERYVASLPATGRQDGWKDDGSRRVPGVHTVEFPRGDTPRGHVRILFHGPFEDGWKARDELEAVGAVLETSLLQTLREDLGGTYGVSVNEGASREPVTTYALSIDFECDPSRLDELLAATWDQIDAVREDPVRPTAIETLQEKDRRSHETALSSNGYWVDALAAALSRGDDPRTLLDFASRNAALTASGVSARAREVLDATSYIQAVQRP
ncbi:MAG: insulinase family protein [Alphaproteobacteria bacterium]|nr:insulinase family protein [Alphaproteobacteria bacterium]